VRLTGATSELIDPRSDVQQKLQVEASLLTEF
jgi:hypothetical protein